IVPALQRHPGGLAPVLDALTVACRAGGSFAATKHFIADEQRSLSPCFELLFDLLVARVGACETVQRAHPCNQLVRPGRSHQGDDLRIAIENDEPGGLHVEHGRGTVGDRDHIDLAPLVRLTPIDTRLQETETERIGLVDLLLRATARAYESPAGE